MKERISIVILGDICPARGFRKEFDEENIEQVFGDVLSTIADSDIVIGNLESPASDRGSPIQKCGPCFCSRPNDVILLGRAGFDILSLANNHILDYGPEALIDTISTAVQAGILTVGAGRDKADAAKCLYVNRGGWKIGILSFAEHEFNVAGESSPGANLFDPYTSLKQINEARQNCDYLIVLYHGGIEEYPLPSPLLQKKCHAIADAGADLILCQHSHCIGTREEYNNVEILYGQGNAVFGKQPNNVTWNEGLLVKVVLDEDGARTEYKVFEADSSGILFLEEPRQVDRIEKMYCASKCLLDQKYIALQWRAFCEEQASMYYPMLFGWNRALNKANRITHNKLIRIFIGKRKKAVTMNLIRCDAHREVIDTVLSMET